MRRAIALLLVVAQVLWPVTAKAQPVGGTSDVGVPYSPTLAEAGPTGATADVSKQRKPATKREQVTQRGTLATAIPIELPPGRSGFAPSLDLAYDSGNASEPSFVGAGFTLPVSFVGRSRAAGTPAIVVANGSRKYSDANDAVRFEHDGQRLVPRDGVPNGYYQEINRDFTKYSYHPDAPSYFLATEKNGTKHFFGNVPDGTLPEALLRDELGVLRWALVRSEDAFGNTIDYRYVAAPPSIGPTAMQRELLLASVQWGAHKPSGQKAHAAAELSYEALPQRQRFDHTEGHVVSDRKLTTIVVKLLRPTPKEVWRYKLDYQTSPTTGRLLLSQVQKHAGSLHAPPIKLSYSDASANDWVSDAKSQLLGEQLEPNVLYDRKNKIAGTRKRGAYLQGFDEFFPPIANKPYWPNEWRTEFEALQQDLSPPGSLSGWDFLDFDGDGDLELTYAPAFAAGFGVPQPWLTFIKQGATWTKLSTIYGKDDPYGMRSGASALVDVDLDGIIDRVALPPLLGIASFGSGTPPDSKVSKQLCNWWFGHQGGYTDPPRDRWAHLWGITTLAAASGQLGIGGSAFDNILGSQLKTPTTQTFLIGGIPSSLGFCYRTNTAANPITVDSFPNYHVGNFGAVGGFVVQKGQIPDGSPINVQKLVSYLQRFPQVLSQPEIEVEPLSGMPTVIRKPNRVSVLNTVQAPLVDLDGDGRPELVAIKAVRSSENHFGPSVWRIRDLKPVHELDDPTTATEFTRSLETILLTKRPSSYLLRGNAQDQTCKAPAPRRPTVPAPTKIRLAIRDRAVRMVPGMGLTQDLQKAVTDAINANAASSTNLGALLDRFDHEGVPTDRLLTLVDWVSTLVDVNGDGLPDFVLAKGATCWSGVNLPTLQTDHKPGFEAYLNRGDRFETSPSTGTAYVSGPLAMVRNWNSQSPLMENGTNFLDEGRYPFSVLSFADLDGDGSSEAILSAQVGDRASSTLPPAGLPTDVAACASLQPDGNAERVRCVWQPSAAGWRGRKDLAARLPTDRAAARLFFDPIRKKFVDGFQFADAQRFVDLDEDGLPEILSLSEHPENDPRRVLRSRGKRPDLLEQIDSGLGATTRASYERVSPAELDRVPAPPWVVRTLTVDPHSNGADTTGKVSSTYSYAGGRWDFEERRSLGFELVTERTAVIQPSGVETSKAIVERKFYQRTPTTQPSARLALAGLLRSLVHRQEPAVTDRQEQSWEYVVVEGQAALPSHRVRLRGETQRHCPAVGCGSTAVLEQVRELSDFDDYDNPKRESIKTTRKLNDGFDSSNSIVVERTFQNDTAQWILGLVTAAVTADAGKVLKQQTQTFDHGRVAHRETQRVPAPTCSAATPLVEDFVWDVDGLLRQEKRKVNDAVTPSIRDYLYTDKLRLWPNEIVDRYRRAGVKSALIEKRYYDPRFGQTVRQIDANGVEKQTQRDALGRVQLEWFNGQLVRRTVHDWNTLPLSTTTTHYPGGVAPEIVKRSYSDGLGRKRQTLTKTTSGAVLSDWAAYDSLGNVAETALPSQRADLSFIPRSAGPGPLTTHLYDGLGRRIGVTQADGRKEEWHFSVGSVEHLDRMGHVRKRYFDLSDREVALEEPGSSRYLVSRDGLGRILATEDPDGSTRRFGYDEANRLVWYEAPHRKTPGRIDAYSKCTDGAGRTLTATTAQGRVIGSRYDELGRLLGERDRDGRELVRYIYDEAVPYGRGRLTTVEWDRGKEHYEYDEHGEVAKRTWESALGTAPPFGNGTLLVSTKRDWLGRIVEQTLPADPSRIEPTLKATFGYDERGLEKSLDVAGKRYAEVAERSPSGRVLRGVLANGLVERWVYSSDVDRLVAIELLSAANAVLSRHALTMYSANDNAQVIERTDGASQETQSFEYDALDRLTKAQWKPASGATTSETYTYSLAGNLTSKGGVKLEYGGVDPQAVSQRGATNYTYDFDGNLTGVSGSDPATLSWNERGLLVSIVRSAADRSTTNLYFPNGLRAAKQTAQGWDQFFDALELRAGGPSAYRLALGPMRFELVLEQPPGKTKLVRNEALDRYLHLDPTGSVASVSDAQPGVGRITYRPFGEVRGIDSKAAGAKHRFTEKETDESGLTYFGARHHDATLGRWTGRDPYALSIPDLILRATPQAANLYAFADNNPVSRQDRNGFCTDDGCNAMGDAGVKMLSKPGGETIGKVALGATAILAVVSLGLPFILTATPTEAALASGAGGAAVQAAEKVSKVVPYEKLAELGSQPGTVVLGQYIRNLPGGVLPALEKILEPAARQLGGETLKLVRPITIEAMKGAMEAATRIVFFTTPNMVGLTAQEMAAIQGSAELMRKTFFVFGSN